MVMLQPNELHRVRMAVKKMEFIQESCPKHLRMKTARMTADKNNEIGKWRIEKIENQLNIFHTFDIRGTIPRKMKWTILSS